MTIKESIMTQYAYIRILWLMSLARNAWTLTISMAGCSFLSGYYLSQHSVILSVVECLIAVVLVFTLVHIIRDFRRRSQPPVEPWLMKAVCEQVMKEAQDNEQTRHD